ncbi:DUF3829 domain-containing protein [Chitinophaga vietnamensis]|uniref:DUF3829 domain-containing protein n=1 Tax=Chitinophaga vietnamensis TaxID=2593957 RepID=UPI0011788933|nr:DUF3829 domain-containing protein [Chitinophaga vietnamensis]
MKKNILIAACSTALLATTVSCNNLGGGKDGAVEAASHVIEYTNLIVDMSNDQNNYLRSAMNNVQVIERDLKHPNESYAFAGVMTTTPFFRPHPMTKANIDKPAEEMSPADRAFFGKAVAQYKSDFARFQAQYKQLDDYVKAQDYKDDKGAKGFALVDSIRSTAQLIYTERAALLKKISEVADASEAVVLKDSPLRDYVLAMKADLKSVRQLIDLLDDNSADYSKISAQAQAAYNALEAAQAKHAAIDTDDAKKADKERSFKRFYEQLHNFLLTAKRVLRDAEGKGTLTESDIHSLDSDLNSLVSTYNLFNS